MLQQTQVDRVLPKYQEFLRAFPSVRALANAPVADVIRSWSGLGYNRRAVLLHRCSQTIVKTHGGTFSSSVSALEQLPGIGPYTARAIATFSFGEDVAVLDTNHRRIIHRLFLGLELPKALASDKKLLSLAEMLLPKGKGYSWNQALMDFGALMCTSRSPKCAICPVQQFCRAYPEIQAASPLKIVLLRRGKRGKEKFEDSDRFYRGRILDILRSEEHLPRAELLRHIRHIRPLGKIRFSRILKQLKKDGLIRMNKKADTIQLP